MSQTIPKRTLDKLAGDGKQFSRNQKEKIGRDLVKRMRARTGEGVDINEDDFANYGSASSRKKNGKLEYLRRKERILGKKISPSSVDIKLMDRLLKSTKVKVNEDGDIEIFHKGELNNLKAAAHNGNKSLRPKGVPKREHFGVRLDDVKNSASKFRAKVVEDGEEE